MSANSFISTLKHLGVNLSHADNERLLIGIKIIDSSLLSTGRRSVVHYSDFLKFIAKHTSLLKEGQTSTVDLSQSHAMLEGGGGGGGGDNYLTDGVRILRNKLRELLMRHSASDGKGERERGDMGKRYGREMFHMYMYNTMSMYSLFSMIFICIFDNIHK
jgi:hypothetical protein